MKKALMIFVLVAIFAGCGEAKKNDGAKAVTGAVKKSQTVAAVPAANNSLIAAGLDHLKQGDVKSAIKSFDEAIRDNPRDVQGYLILGQTYMHLKDYNRAIDTFIVATRVDPENGQAHYLLATNLGLAGNYTMARVQAEKSAEIFRKEQDGANFKRSVALLQGLPADNLVQP